MIPTPGTRLGPYEIVAKLGEGGMGLVYRAKDFQLGREVALKVLPEGFTQDPERLARFEREAKLLAQLNHPNIAQIYGLEVSGDTRALVMELVDGPTLAERLESGPLPFNESLSLSLQIAQALEEAHEKGIVHRDLKPQNIKASIEGKVKVLDFGLAKAMEPAGAAFGGAASASQLAHSPTLTIGATLDGVILGSAAYMAPEQAKGLAVDKRADVWAFGVVLYEMLTGARLFAGDSIAETLAKVLQSEIDFAALPKSTPAPIRRLLRRCLERNPRNRLHDIADARIVIDDMLAGRHEIETVTTPAGPGPSRATIVVALLGAAAFGALAMWLARPRAAPAAAPAQRYLTASERDSLPAVSADGRMLAFVSDRDGRRRIWLKQLAGGEEAPITSGPDDAPRFSPDGSMLLFARAGDAGGLFLVPVVGGEPHRILAAALSGDWSPDGRRIAFVRETQLESGPRRILGVVGANGEGERELAQIPGSSALSLRWSPDGQRISAIEGSGGNTPVPVALSLYDPNGRQPRRVLATTASGVWVGGCAWSGRGEHLLCAETIAVSGSSVPTEIVRYSLDGGRREVLITLPNRLNTIDVAGDGRLVVETSAARENLREVAIGRPDDSRTLTRGAASDRQPSYSPDDQRIAFSSDRSGNIDVWAVERSTGALQRLTHDPAADWDPSYSADGRRLLWSSNRSGNFEIWSAHADGSGARQLSRDGLDAENPVATPDGSWILYSSSNPAKAGIWKIRPDGSEAMLLAAGNLLLPEISSDGRHFACAERISTIGSILQVRRIDDGELVARAETSRQGDPIGRIPNLLRGRARWLPGGSAIAYVDFDAAGRAGLFVGELRPGQAKLVGVRPLAGFDPQSLAESFGFSPDGSRVALAAVEESSALLLVEGVPRVEALERSSRTP